jgi:hypothetical protein
MRKRAFDGCILVFGVLALAGGCAKKEGQADKDRSETAEETAMAPDVPRVVLDMIDAHGGMVAWRGAGTVSFEDEFSTPASPPTVSRVMVEQRSRRAYIDFPGTDMSIAWDGKRAWGVNWTAPYPPRFLALLNYYFVNLPWLTMDPGVKLRASGTGTVRGDSTACAVVMMTFEPGTGDTPEDYYRLYIDPATKRLRACDYVVTYSSLLPEGVEHSPEHHLVYETFDTVNGLVVPTAYTVYEGDSLYATCKVRNWAFGATFDPSRMAMPEGAAADTSTP